MSHMAKPSNISSIRVFPYRGTYKFLYSFMMCCDVMCCYCYCFDCFDCFDCFFFADAAFPSLVVVVELA
jgi:hypothetical protein